MVFYWSWNSDKEKRLGSFYVCIYLHSSWEGKYENDRLPNEIDLIKRCFVFILKSLKGTRDWCLKNEGHSFIF